MPSDQTEEKAIRDLLSRYSCPLGYHKVRTRMLGAMARPDLDKSPAAVIADIWGRESLEMQSLDQSHDLYRALGKGLWQELSQHRDLDVPFRGVQMPLDPSVANLDVFGMIRIQEIEGFVEGLFNNEEEARLPVRAYETVMHLGDIRSTMFGLTRLMKSASEGTGNKQQVIRLIRHFQVLTDVMEAEIHDAFLSCLNAGSQSFVTTIAPWQTRH